MSQDQTTLYCVSQPEATRMWLQMHVEAGKLRDRDCVSLIRSTPWLAQSQSDPSSTEIDDFNNKLKEFSLSLYEEAKDFKREGKATAQILAMRKIAKDLGSVFSRVHYKEYGGKRHIIFKGNAAGRKIITGTKYGVNNPKLVKMGLGAANMKNAMRSTGTIVSVVFITVASVTQYMLDDEATLADLIGKLGSEFAKLGVVMAASVGTAAVLAGTAIGTFALGPLVGALIVGYLVGKAVDWIDREFELTEKLTRFLNKVCENADAWFKEQLQQGRAFVEDLTETAYEYAEDAMTDIVHRSRETMKNAVKRKLCNQTFVCYPIPYL